MVEVLTVGRSVDGLAAYIKNFPDNGSKMTSTDAQSFTFVVPSDHTIAAVLPSANGDFYMSQNDDAGNPGSTWEFTTSELNPGPRWVRPGQTLYFYTPKAVNITLAFHRVF